jgi:hypothetical protein
LYYSDTKILDRTTKAENEEKLFSYFVLGTPFFQKFINELDLKKCHNHSTLVYIATCGVSEFNVR